MTEQTQPLLTDALARLRHLYSNLMNGGVRDTASAKRIAEGLLSPVIADLEKWGTPAPVGVEPALHQYQASDGTWKDFDSERHRRDTVAAGYPVRTLYTVTHVQAGAVPMTPEQVVDAFCKQPHTVQFVEAFINGVRFAERHHGIKGSQHER